MGTLKIYEAWPDIAANAFGFCIDPANLQKVWFFVRNTGTNTWAIPFGFGIEVPPSGNVARGPTEAFHIEFDTSVPPRVRKLSIGYPCDRFEGNTNGLGAYIGLLTNAGVPTSFAKPQGTVFKLLQRIGNKIPGAAKTVSDEEDLPVWWPTKDVRGADGL